MESSYYQATRHAEPRFAPLSGVHEARVAIVGGGYSGLATALGLAERGVRDVVLLEAEEVGHGASGRNGGFVFGGYSLGEGELLRTLGPERARRTYARTIAAVNLVRERIARHAIDCAPVDEGVIWANWFRDERVLRERAELLHARYGVEWEWIAPARMRELVASERYGAGVWERNALHVHPLNMALGFARAASGQGVRIHERTPANRLERDGTGWHVTAPGGSVRAEHVVLACGGYLAGLRPEIDRSILPIATYVMATEPLGTRLNALFPGTRAAVYDTRFAFDYFRPLTDTRLLWGGRISVFNRAPAEVARLLRADLMKVFPQLSDVRVDFAWNGLMGYARHQMPQLGRVEPGLWCAQGYGGHGVATTTAGGEVIAAAIAEGDRGWEDFSPFGFDSTYKPTGYVAAQAKYWWLELRDALKAFRER